MKIKICGITNLSDAKCALENGADLIGFILYQKSPRYVSPESVKEILSQLPTATTAVGVFVNEATSMMQEIYQFCGLSMLQLHGLEPPRQLEQLKPIKVLRSISLQTPDDLGNLRNYSPYRFLVDTPSEHFGGTGKVANWKLAHKAAKAKKIFLAGGLNPENVVQAIREVRPYGVDVSSGVEKAKGVKDHRILKNFIYNVHQAVNN